MSATALTAFAGTLRANVKVESPLWWLDKLEWRLLARQAKMLELDRYYRGDHPLPFLTTAHNAKMRNEFSKLLQDSRSNFMRLVVDVVEERLKVEGFRLSASSEPVADKATWDIWQANQLDADSQVAFVEALVKGVSYLSVWDDVDDDGYPDIRIEDPLQTIVFYEPGTNYRKRAAAVKVWLDDITSERRANVYLPDGIYKFKASAASPDIRAIPTPEQQSRILWSEIKDGFVKNPHGVVPIVPLRNRPRLLVEGESELEDVYRVQNQINGFLFLRALAGYFGAHRQRWAVGLTLMEDPNGKPVEPFNTAIDTLWMSENPATQFGEFQQTDLAGYNNSIEQMVMHIAITTRTPKHYLLPTGQEPSGDAIKSAESGLVKKVERKQRPYGEGLEEALRLARLFAGEKDAPVDSEIVWADPRVQSVAEVTDAVIKKFQAGLIPTEQALEDLGYTQSQITRMQNMAPSTLILPRKSTEIVAAAPGSPEEAESPTVVEPVPAAAP